MPEINQVDGDGDATRQTKDLRNFASDNGEIETLTEDSLKCLKFGKLLGSGGFGNVYEGKFRGTQVAVKRMHINTKNPRAVLESFYAETSIGSFNHINIVRTIAASGLECTLNERIVVMEFAGDRTLKNIIDNENDIIDEDRRLNFAIQITRGLEYIHQRDIAHLDVKPSNIIVNAQDCCKIGDFGCSTLVYDSDDLPPSPTHSYLTGTFAYRAPELLKGEPPTCKADLYSLGICLWQLLTRERPYGSENIYVIVFGVVAYHLRPYIEKSQENLYIEVAKSLWKAVPSERPSAAEVLPLLLSITNTST